MMGRDRGRGRGAPYHGTSYHHRGRGNDKIVVENIPSESCTLDNVNEFFKKFGTILNIQMQPQSRKAIIQFKSPDDAFKAWRSPDTIFENRFVKVYFHDPSSADNADNGNVSTTNNEKSAKTSAIATSASATSSAFPQVGMSPVQSFTQVATTAADQNIKQMKAMMEIQKQKDAFVQKQIDFQKELMEKLSSKALTPKERETLMSALKTGEEAAKSALESAASVNAAVQAKIPVKLASRQELEKEKLDRDLDAFNSGVRVDTANVDPALKSQLEALEAEVLYLVITFLY
jgi:RNA-binding protein 26